MRQRDTGEHFPDDSEEGDGPVVVAIAAVSFVFIQGDDATVPYVLGNVPLLPYFVAKRGNCIFPP